MYPMKIVFILTLIVALISTSCVGCFVILDFYSLTEAADSLLEVLAVILLLGFSSAIIVPVIGRQPAGSAPLIERNNP